MVIVCKCARPRSSRLAYVCIFATHYQVDLIRSTCQVYLIPDSEWLALHEPNSGVLNFLDNKSTSSVTHLIVAYFLFAKLSPKSLASEC
jgi:hypothetical protein